MKVLITEGTYQINLFNIFKSLGHDPYILSLRSIFEEKDFDLFIFSGGTDIHPENYDEENRYGHFFNIQRDKFEIELVYRALNIGGKLLGICRGHQLINVALGGTLYQDVKEIPSKHHKPHKLEEISPGIVPYYFKNMVNSSHHQAVKKEGLLLRTTTIYDHCIESTENEQIITVQFHPEGMHQNISFRFFAYTSGWAKTDKINLYKGYI